MRRDALPCFYGKTGMPTPDARRWNERYLEDQESWLARTPRPLLVEYAHILPTAGLALDAAAGVSANGLFLAHRGLRVIALDISEVALKLATRRAREERVNLWGAVLDLSNLWLPCDTFDVILNFLFLERATFKVYREALKPGGLIFFETFVNRGRELSHSDYYLEPGELLKAFEGFHILHWDEKQITRSCDGSQKWVAQLVGIKPSD